MSVGVGIVGLGSRGLRGLGTMICRIGREAGIHIAAVCDPHPQRLSDAADQLRAMARTGGVPDDFTCHSDDDGVIGSPDVDVVVITSPQDGHEATFVKAARAGKLIFCEKPLAASPEGCEAMRAAWQQYRPRVMTGLTRRYENVWLRAKELVDSGAVGRPQMMLLRSIIPYHRYFGGWWRNSARSGDLLNEKSSHHFDVFNWFAEGHPTTVWATGGRNVFLPREGYPHTCAECDRVCPYRRPGPRSHEDYTEHFRLSYDDDPDDLLSRNLCVYSDEADVLDHAIVTADYGGGIKASLFFGVFGPDTVDQETLEVVGDSGKLVLTRHDATIEQVSAHGEHRAHHDCAGPHAAEGHFGADRTLVRQLVDFARGADPVAGFADAHRASMIAFSAQDSLRDGDPRRLADVF